MCEKVVLKESLSKHIQDIHEKSNKMKCEICSKILAGPFSLKAKISFTIPTVRHICHCIQMLKKNNIVVKKNATCLLKKL